MPCPKRLVPSGCLHKQYMLLGMYGSAEHNRPSLLFVTSARSTSVAVTFFDVKGVLVRAIRLCGPGWSVVS